VIETEKATYPIKRMRELREVSRSGFYRWRVARDDPRAASATSWMARSPRERRSVPFPAALADELATLMVGTGCLLANARSPASRVPVRVVMAAGCVLVSAAAGCSSRSPGSTPSTPASTSAVAPLPATSAIQDGSIPGIGATRANWDDSHTPNAANNNGSAYGDDPSLPSYLTTDGAVYSNVGDLGTERIQYYTLYMHTADPLEALRRLRQELPSDATVAWDLTLNQCYRVAVNSPTLQAAGHYMADVQLEYFQEDGTRATNPDRFNIASFWLDEAGSPPNPEKGC
jgi:hypothetical protein